MIIAQMITEFVDAEFDDLFESSYPFIKENTGAYDQASIVTAKPMTKAEIHADLKHELYSRITPEYHCCIWRDSDTGKAMAFTQGKLSEDGTLDADNFLVGSAPDGSRSWVYQLADHEWSQALMNPVGIYRINFYPVSKNNLADFMVACGCSYVGTDTTSHCRPHYRTSWGWS